MARQAKGVTSVPAPAPARFIHGTYPPTPSIQAPARVKPDKASTRDYGKMPSPTGNTGLTGQS